MMAFLLALMVGVINAFIVVRIGVNSLVATLGMGTLLYGSGVRDQRGQHYRPFQHVDDDRPD